jgi:hypothetical protein
MHTISASSLHRLGTEDLATPGQPVRPEVVIHVLGIVRHPCLRVGQVLKSRSGWDSNPRHACTAVTFREIIAVARSNANEVVIHSSQS